MIEIVLYLAPMGLKSISHSQKTPKLTLMVRLQIAPIFPFMDIQFSIVKYSCKFKPNIVSLINKKQLETLPRFVTLTSRRLCNGRENVISTD